MFIIYKNYNFPFKKFFLTQNILFNEKPNPSNQQLHILIFKSQQKQMSVVDITADFLSYVQDTHISYNSSWNTSTFIKSANSSLQQMVSLQSKVSQIKKIVRSSSRFDKEMNNKMITNIKQTIKSKQQMIKRLSSTKLDMKGSSYISQKFRNSLLTALQMRLLKTTFQFKEVYQQNSLKNRPSTRKGSKVLNQDQNKTTQINLNTSHFLQKSEMQIIQQTSIKQYKQIQKTINDIYNMYKQTFDTLKMHDLLIDSIQNNIGEIDDNVNQGNKNLSQAHRRQSKNKSLIIKMFTALYIITFLYIVFLS